MHDQWIETIQQQIDKLEITAEWASIVGYGTVRDHIRIAIYDLKYKIDRFREQGEERTTP